MRKVDSIYLEAWAYFEAFRRLGFVPDDIYLALATEDERTVVMVELRTEERDFVVRLGSVSQTQDEVEIIWGEFVAALASGEFGEEELTAVWESSLAYKDSDVLVAGMLEAGFVFPKSMN